jgi:hypothetical protein
VCKDKPYPFPFGIPANPDQDHDVTALVLRFCIGDDQNPDEIIDIRASGNFRIDDSLRAAIRAVPVDALEGLSPDDIDVRETELHPMGVTAHLFDVWLQAQALALPTNVIGAAIWDGCKQVWQKGAAAMGYNAADDRFALPPEKAILVPAESALREDLDVQGELTQISVNITDASSGFKFTGSVVLRAEDGRDFELSVDHDLHRCTTVRIRPKRSKG